MDKEQAINEMNSLLAGHWAEIEKRKAQRLEQISKLQAECNTEFGKWDELKKEAEQKIADLRKAAPNKIEELKAYARSAINRILP